ncbi:MAG: hypothetical protein FJ005_03015 [Chloroflexi bacterium]|nr:hypothetical protein [Chloroflexota bacterium]
MRQMGKCPNCGTQSAGLQFCTTCGMRLPAASQQQVWEPQPTPGAKPTAREAPTRKYGALRAVAIIYNIIGWVICVGGSLLSIAAAVMAAQDVAFLKDLVPEVAGAAGVGAAVIAVGGVVVSVLCGLFLVAFADLCNVAIDIEQNTRLQE